MNKKNIPIFKETFYPDADMVRTALATQREIMNKYEISEKKRIINAGLIGSSIVLFAYLCCLAIYKIIEFKSWIGFAFVALFIVSGLVLIKILKG
jgi:hypothetical protein